MTNRNFVSGPDNPPIWVEGKLRFWNGTTYEPANQFDSMEEFQAAGGAAANPGPVWIGNRSGVTIGDSTKFTDLLIPAQNITFIGDSRVQRGYFRGVKAATGTPISSMALNWQGVGPGVTSDGTGSLEYRASDRSLRWTAQGDTAGPWTPIVYGWQKIESGTADKWIAVVKGNSTFNESDATISMPYSGSLYEGWEHHGFAFHLLAALKFPYSPTSNNFIGVGGAIVSDLASIADSLTEMSSGSGIDIIRIGTNDISVGTNIDDLKASATILFNSRIRAGRFVVWVGESARYATGTTPLTTDQLADLIEFNKHLRELCTANPGMALFIDHYALTVDPAYLDGRPISNVLADFVHDSVYGAMLLADEIAAKLIGIGVQKGFPIQVGDSANICGIDFNLQSTAAATGTGALGLKPFNFSTGRTSGSDATITGSVEARTDATGNWFVLDIAQSTAAAQTLFVTGPNIDFASAGLVVGDFIEWEMELFIESAVSINSIEAIMLCNGATTNRKSIHKLTTTTNVGIAKNSSPVLLKSFPQKIPAGTTTLDFWLYIVTSNNASAAATIKLGKIALKKAATAWF